MRNITRELLTHLMLAIQVASPIVGFASAVPLSAHAQAETPVPYHLQLDVTAPTAVTVKVTPQPNFDTDVLVPLRAAQAAEAERVAKAMAKRKLIPKPVQPVRLVAAVPVTEDGFYLIRMCESGSVYTRNSGNGYYGAYQYNLGTWANYGGFARPDLAPAEVQDAKAHADVATRGWSPWANCARNAGLM